MGCNGCSWKSKTFNQIKAWLQKGRRTPIQNCKYKKSEIEDLLPKASVIEKITLRSAINVYGSNCGAFEKQIDVIKSKILQENNK